MIMVMCIIHHYRITIYPTAGGRFGRSSACTADVYINYLGTPLLHQERKYVLDYASNDPLL